MKLNKMHRLPRRPTGSPGKQISFSGTPRKGGRNFFPQSQIDPARGPSLPVRPPFFQSGCSFGRVLGERESDSRFFRKVNVVNVRIFLFGSLCLKKPKLSFVERAKRAIENLLLKYRFEYQLAGQLSSFWSRNHESFLSDRGFSFLIRSIF